MNSLYLSVDNPILHECLFILSLMSISVVLLIIIIEIDPFILKYLFDSDAQLSLRVALLNLVVNPNMIVCYDLLKFIIAVS
jgi:hypothetical protein